MTGKIHPFRSRFMGGFNRQDVIDYIAKLAEERNAQRAAKDMAEQEARTLADEIERLKQELEKAQRELENSKRSNSAHDNKIRIAIRPISEN